MSETERRYGFIAYHSATGEVEYFKVFDRGTPWATAHNKFEEMQKQYIDGWDHKSWRVAFLDMEVYG